ncbi:hypothetical protein H4582DRAFT_2070373 [Lactarius indigo]|nr:hypothetical protein H4582DRAFT_2070373 [Lactarius indigo]
MESAIVYNHEWPLTLCDPTDELNTNITLVHPPIPKPGKKTYQASTLGTYFDSVPAILATWPSAELPAISVVQDPLDVPTSSSAQPVVFFHLNHLLVLASSPLLVQTHAGRRPPALPHVTFLDLSTSRISTADVSIILRSLPHLRHLIFDHCGLPDDDDADARDWVSFAYHCLSVGDSLLIEAGVNRQLAAATSGTGESRPREVRALPRALALRTLSLSVLAYADPDARSVLIAAFWRAWGEAVVMFNRSKCAARQLRAKKGVLALRFPCPDDVGHTLREPGLPRMVVVDDDDEFSRLSVLRDSDDCPVVCLAGQNGREEGIERAEGCSHSIGWDIWEDTL